MAVTPSTLPVSALDDDFDPFGPIDLEVIHPKWSTTPAEFARSGNASYDRTVDTLHILQPRNYRGGVVVEVGDERFVIVDQDSHVVVGIQIEATLARVVEQVPALFDELERAELREITREQIEEHRLRVAASGIGPGPTLAEFYAPEAWSKPIWDDELDARSDQR